MSYSRSVLRQSMRHVVMQASCGAAILLTACSQNPVGPRANLSASTSAAHISYVYVCCTTADVGMAWRAGQTIALHWIAQQSSPSPIVESSRSSAIPLKFQAELRGPYSSVITAKATPLQAQLVASSNSYATDDWAGRSFAVSLALPANLTPGYYDLRTIEMAPGQSDVGDIVITVSP